MQRTFSIFIFLFTLKLFSQEIGVEFDKPSRFRIEIFNETLSIRVKITSTYEVKTVNAIFNDKIIPLSLSTDYEFFIGSISLEDQVQGLHELTIEVEDILGNKQLTNREFIYDKKPRLNIISPANSAVARPELKIEFDAFDEKAGLSGNVRLEVEVIRGDDGDDGKYNDLLIQSNKKINQNIDLSEYGYRKSQILYLLFKATDERRQTTSIEKKIYIESNPLLIKEYEAENEIENFDGKNVISVYNESIDKRTDIPPPYAVTDITLSDIQSGDSHQLLNIDTLKLHSLVFTRKTPKSISNNGIIIPHPLDEFSKSLTDNQKQFYYNKNTQLSTEIFPIPIEGYDYNDPDLTFISKGIVLDLHGNKVLRLEYACRSILGNQDCRAYYYIQSTLDYSKIIPLQGFQDFNPIAEVLDVLENNKTLYTDEDGNIVLYEDGAKTYITNDAISKRKSSNFIRYTDIKNDGNLFVYTRSEGYDELKRSLILYNHISKTKTILKEENHSGVYSASLKNGSLIYFKKGNLGQDVIMLRKTSGETLTVSPFGTNSYIWNINNIGEIVFMNQQSVYLYDNNEKLVKIYDLPNDNNSYSQIASGSYFYNNKYYVTIGNTLFSIKNSGPLSNDVFTKHIENEITISPNPFSNKIIIDFYSNNASNKKTPYSIFNLQGQNISSGTLSNLNNNSSTIDLKHLDTGMYILSIDNKIMRKIIKN